MLVTALWVAVNHEHRNHCYFVCCLYAQNISFQLQEVFFFFCFSFMHKLNIRNIRRLSASILECKVSCDSQDDVQNAPTLLHKPTNEMLF